ncbi:MAG: hypothetical protein MI700_13535 [Balneolales bacterium]|nr:hypothetical protein [Balneolales bacterium]
MASSLQQVLHKQFKEDAIAYLQQHPEEFEQLVEISLSNQPHQNWRAAWLVFHMMEENDPRVLPLVNTIIDVLPAKQEGHQRELMKILERMELSEEQESVLFDFSVELWESIRKKPSVRYRAFVWMVNIGEKYPELIPEILMLAQPQYVNSLSPGIKNSVRKMVAKLERTNSRNQA